MTSTAAKAVALAVAIAAIAFAVFVAVHGPADTTVSYAPSNKPSTVVPTGPAGGSATGSAAAAGRPSPSATVTVSTGPTASPSATGPIRALFVGDQYAIGTKDAPGYPNATCLSLKWDCFIDAQGGTGFVADGHLYNDINQPYAGRLKADQRDFPKADVVVVTSGRSDLGYNGTAQAAGKYFASVRKAYPRSLIVAVEPLWPAAGRPERVLEFDEEVRRAGFAVDAVTLSTDSWLTPDLLGRDSGQLSADGQDRVSAQLVLGLRKATRLLGRA